MKQQPIINIPKMVSKNTITFLTIYLFTEDSLDDVIFPNVFIVNNNKNCPCVLDTAFDMNLRLTDNGCYGVMLVNAGEIGYRK